MKRIYTVLAATVIAAGIASSAMAGKSDDTLVVALNKEIQTLDSLYSTKRETIILGHMVSDGLVVLNPETNEYEPALAESFRFSDDATAVFKLRAGVKFHDGSPVTADDIVYSFNWIANKDSKTRRGKFIRSWFKSIEKIDDRTVRISAKAPYPLMLRDIAMFVQTRKKDIYGADGNFDLKAQTQTLNGTGPYKVVSFGMGKGVTLERFDGYYAGSPKAKGAIKRIVLRPIPEWGTVAAEMMSKGVQWSFNVPDDIAQNLGSTPLVDHVAGPSTRIAFLLLDAKGATGADKPLTKLKVRQALNHAVNREALVKHLVKGSSRVIHTACYPGMFGCTDDVTKYTHDPEKAKKLLAEAGYPKGFKFDMWAYREKPISEAVAADLAKVGVKANLRYVKLSALSKARSKYEIESYHGTWGYYGTPDVGAISNHFVAGSNRNLTGDAEVEGLFKSALETTDGKARKTAYGEALKKISAKAYWVPLYQYTQNYIVSKDVKFSAPQDGIPRLNRLSWK
ncbi:MAG: ABC transporter substrate-binding protein [Pseudomonadota bacterium]